MIWRFFQICRWIFDFRLGADLTKLAVSKLFRTKLFPPLACAMDKITFLSKSIFGSPETPFSEKPDPFPPIYPKRYPSHFYHTPNILLYILYYYILYIIYNKVYLGCARYETGTILEIGEIGVQGFNVGAFMFLF